MPRTRPSAEVVSVFALKDEGHTDWEISRLTGVPVNTIRAWRRLGPPQHAKRALEGLPDCATCGKPEHDFGRLNPTAYAYLLGLYLGDGCVTAVRGSWSLRVVLDKAYPGIIGECARVIGRIRGQPPCTTPSRRNGSVVVSSGWKSWACLLPQHGPGRKHDRSIALTEWQQHLVDRAPGSLLRGLIHTDGWRGVNHVNSKGRQYEYSRYQFSNRSDDIRRLFTDTCDALGIEWKPWTRYHVSVARRSAVARLDEFVGPKA